MLQYEVACKRTEHAEREAPRNMAAPRDARELEPVRACASCRAHGHARRLDMRCESALGTARS